MPAASAATVTSVPFVIGTCSTLDREGFDAGEVVSAQIKSHPSATAVTETVSVPAPPTKTSVVARPEVIAKVSSPEPPVNETMSPV